MALKQVGTGIKNGITNKLVCMGLTPKVYPLIFLKLIEGSCLPGIPNVESLSGLEPTETLSYRSVSLVWNHVQKSGSKSEKALSD